MFFKIESTVDSTFPTHVKLTDELWLNADEGWECYSTDQWLVVFKGYIDCYAMSVELIQTLVCGTPLSGNFAAICVNNEIVTILHDTDRAFPLFVDELSNIVHNMLEYNCKVNIPSDKRITIRPGFRIEHIQIDNYYENYAFTDVAAVTGYIDKLLTKKFIDFLSHNSLPITIFVTGGVDTIICWAYLKRLGAEYTLLQQSVNANKFMLQHPSIRDYWGYTQFAYNAFPSVLVSGAMGDETMMRGPVSSVMLTHASDIDFVGELNTAHYHYLHHTSPINKEKYANCQFNDATVINDIINITRNDHQHWHLDSTITFTPFKDINILRALLSLDCRDLMGQMLDATISKDLIIRNSPDLLTCVDKYKNQHRYLGTTIDFEKFTKYV